MKRGKKEAVYINGIFYKSFFFACTETGISSVGVWKALKKTNGNPTVIKKNFLTTESWIFQRKATLKMRYGI